MRAELPVPVRLAAYTPFPFACDGLSLCFRLDAGRTRVTAASRWRRVGEGLFRLDGELLEVLAIRVDGHTLSPEGYDLDAHALTLHAVPDAFTLETEVAIAPDQNTALSGLYLSSGRLCTQCEAEGFRRITFWPDRPDVMARMEVELLADPSLYPTLLSNGDLIETGRVDEDLHFARWRDPHPKPSYLFALVAGSFDVLSDTFTTASGRVVSLGIYVEAGDAPRAAYAMDSLKRSMRWDEEKFGREYDLDVFNIVAVRDFNFGAMENKGLNIFNAAYVLADAETATDATFEAIESIVAHEYFHNWTGNRITCRDWFQLSLKEGLTVFRDQEFSADQRSAAVTRIKDVITLRQRQFAEDAGPLAHPVRPREYASIDNFYTATVYEKGAEVIRMLRTLLGEQPFADGMQLYFERFDGTAATVEDFVSCFEEASGTWLGPFMLWYDQAGTPEVSVQRQWDAGTGTLTLALSQHTPPTPGQPEKQPLVIPLRLALFGAEGTKLTGQRGGKAEAEALVVVDTAEATVSFTGLPVGGPMPLVSINRGFSAPAKVMTDLRVDERAILAGADDDAFAQWDALQDLVRGTVLAVAESLRHGGAPDASPALDAVVRAFRAARPDPEFAALLLGVPTVGELMQALEVADPDALHEAREAFRRTLADRLHPDLAAVVAEPQDAPFSADAAAAGRRSLRGAAMALLSMRGLAHAPLLEAAFAGATTMTDSMAALRALANLPSDAFDRALAAFRTRWNGSPLVMDLWFGVQAGAVRPDTRRRLEGLVADPDFDLKVPNRARSIYAGLPQGNPVTFHAPDGWGYRFLAEAIATADGLNPALAARLAGAFETWRKLEPGRRVQAEHVLRGLASLPGLSRNLTDILTRTLG
jgi:aminopeptidase N